MKIPTQFTIHGHTIKVIKKEIDSEARFGYYDSVKEEIVIFTKIKSNGEIVTLTETQLEATFYHEVIHAIQWHLTGDTDEREAQSYAGLLIELFHTSVFDETI